MNYQPGFLLSLHTAAYSGPSHLLSKPAVSTETQLDCLRRLANYHSLSACPLVLFGLKSVLIPLHSVFPRIRSKNPKFLFFEPKTSFGMFLRQLVKWFFHLCDFRAFFDFLKKCRFADFSTLHKKSLVKFYVFSHSFQTCRWICRISSASLVSIYGSQFVLSGF